MQPGKNGFHVGEDGEYGPCNATTRTCKYGSGPNGSDNHFKTEAEAKAAGEAIKERTTKQPEKLTKRKKSTGETASPAKTQDERDIENAIPFSAYTTDSSMDAKTRGDLLSFEASKIRNSLEIGRIVTDYDEKDLYGLGSGHGAYGQVPVLHDDEREKLIEFTKNHPVESAYLPKRKGSVDGMHAKKFLDAGYKIDYVPNSLEETSDDVFTDTESPNTYEAYLNYRAVLTNPDGEKMVVNVSNRRGYGSILDTAIQLADEMEKKEVVDKKINRTVKEDLMDRSSKEDDMLSELNDDYRDVYDVDDDEW